MFPVPGDELKSPVHKNLRPQESNRMAALPDGSKSFSDLEIERIQRSNGFLAAVCPVGRDAKRP
jgi:hypothetical protein